MRKERQDLPSGEMFIIEERLPKQEKARKPDESQEGSQDEQKRSSQKSSDGKVSKQGQRKRKERKGVLQSPTQEAFVFKKEMNDEENSANKKIKKKRGDQKIDDVDNVPDVKGFAEESFDINDTEQEQRKSKKREEVSRSGHSFTAQEALALKDESAQGINETKRKKKSTRDRWGQKVQDAENSEDIKEWKNEFQAACIPRKEGQCDMKKICVSGMPYDTAEEDILEFFAECGSIAEVNCSRFSDTARFKGLAFITFKTEAAARKALALDGAEMGGRFIKIEQIKEKRVLRDPPKKIEGCLSAYIGNLTWDVQKIDVKKFFKNCNINSVRLAVNRNTGEFQGYGHVDFADEASLERGIKLNQKQLLGRPIKVAYAVSK